MPQVVKKMSNRYFGIVPDHNGIILSLGPAATSSSVGTFVIQFNPDEASDYAAVLMGRCWGPAASDRDVPFLPIPYRRCTVNNAASDYAIVSDTITGPTMIQVPANWEIGMLVSASQGQCDVLSWDLQGNSNP